MDIVLFSSFNINMCGTTKNNKFFMWSTKYFSEWDSRAVKMAFILDFIQQMYQNKI